MRHWMLASMLVLAGLIAGCEKPKPAVEEKKIEIDAPGVKVEVGGEKGVEVKAPGVDVETKKE